MDIEDLLEEHEPELYRKHVALKIELTKFDSKLIQIMKDTAGKEVILALEETFDNPDYEKSWYFSRIPSMEGKRPYDFCVEGNKERVIETLGKIRYSIY